jgi:membrane-associated phospholipid phosphatase
LAERIRSETVISSEAHPSKVWALPLFFNKKNKYPMGILMAIFAIAVYLPANHFHLSEPSLLPMHWIDTAIPFLPESVWIYISEYLFFVVVYLTCKDLGNLNKYFYSFLVLQVVSVVIFWLLPTTYPRDQFPLPLDLDAVTFFAFRLLRVADTPANCCPSLHVSSVYLSSFIFLDDQKKKFPLFFLWGTAIAVSTLTTKQHYLIDVVTGLIMALATYWIFHKYIPYRQVESSQLNQKA